MTTGIRYLVDENLRGPLWHAILAHNAADADHPLDALRVGDRGAPPLGTKDRELIAWAEREDRILVTFDRRTLIGLLRDHLAAGRGSPGLFLVPRAWTVPSVLDQLVTAAYASEAAEWRDQASYL